MSQDQSVFGSYQIFGQQPLLERVESVDIIAPLLGGVISGILYEKLNNNYLLIILLGLMLVYLTPSPFTYGIAVGMLGFGFYRLIKKQFVIEPSSSE